MTDSRIEVSAGGTMFVGPDATELFRAITLKSAIRMATVGLVATRGFSLTKGLAMATRYTGKKYKRTQAAQAIADIQTWCDTMKAGLPVVQS